MVVVLVEERDHNTGGRIMCYALAGSLDSLDYFCICRSIKDVTEVIHQLLRRPSDGIAREDFCSSCS